MLGCQSRFDCALELSRIGLHIALVAAQHGAVFAHEKLLEVPGHGASGLGLAEGGVGLFCHHHFVEQLKISAIGAGAELLDLWQRSGLLGAEIVAGKAEHGQTLGAVALLKRLQA